MVALACTCFLLPALHAESYRPGTTVQQVEVLYEDFTDRDRDREVPVKIFLPESQEGPAPVVLWSHGLGGNRDGADYLGQHLAKHGYVAVHVQHPGSDSSLWKAKNSIMELRKAMEGNASIENFLSRIGDVEFVLDELNRLNRSSTAYKDRFDMRRVGMSGHSFGAITTQAVIGQEFRRPSGEAERFMEDRIKAAILMSPSPPTSGQDEERSFSQVRVPVLHLTGTDDSSPFDWFPATDRRVPFDNMDRSDQYLLIFNDVDHVAFSGHQRRINSLTAHCQDTSKEVALAFWDAYLKDRPEAQRWLQATSAGVTTLLNGGDVWELKD